MSAASKDDPKLLALALTGTAFLGVIAFVLSIVTATPLAPQFHWSLRDSVIGVVGAVPLCLFLWWIMTTTRPVFARFRDDQIEFFSQIGFRFTPLRIVLMAAFAGVFEEILFRGALQSALVKVSPLLVALLVSNLIFGAVHWRTSLYALIAGVIGVWMGVLFALTGNLITPILTHALYDLIALWVTARAITARRADKMSALTQTIN